MKKNEQQTLNVVMTIEDCFQPTIGVVATIASHATTEKHQVSVWLRLLVAPFYNLQCGRDHATFWAQTLSILGSFWLNF